jgi:thioredoxin-like negative regulator of GroEL
MADQFEFILVDGDANRKIVEQLGVRGYPTVVFYKNGQRIDVQYSRSKVGFTQALKKLL